MLPYSDQQVTGTFGGPLILNKAHFFGYYEGERNPQSFTFTSPYPAFNIAPLVGVNTQKLSGARVDFQLKPSMHLMARANGWIGKLPYDPDLLRRRDPSSRPAARISIARAAMPSCH